MELKFKECVEFSSITCRKQPCLDVSTRWNSTYMMLDVAGTRKTRERQKVMRMKEKTLHIKIQMILKG